MGLLTNELTRAMLERERDLPQTFTWTNVVYPCARRVTVKGTMPTEGGGWVTAAGGLTVRRELLPAIPKEGAQITVDGAVYTVLSVADDAAIPLVIITFGKVPKPS